MTKKKWSLYQEIQLTNQSTNQPTVYKNKNTEITIQPMEEKIPKKRFIQVVTFVNTTKGLATFYLSRSWSIENCFLLFVCVCVWEREETDRDKEIVRDPSDLMYWPIWTPTQKWLTHTHACIHPKNKTTKKPTFFSLVLYILLYPVSLIFALILITLSVYWLRIGLTWRFKSS